MTIICRFFSALLFCFLCVCQLPAQCGPSGEPAISIENHCVQPGATVELAIRVKNWGDVHAWNLGFCVNSPKGFKFLEVVSQVSGQTIASQQEDGSDFSLHYGKPTDCDNLPGIGETTIAIVRFEVLKYVPNGECAAVTLCNSGLASISRAYQCKGSLLIPTKVSGCDGGVCIGIPNMAISGKVTTIDGKPLENCEVGIVGMGMVGITDSQGEYQITNLNTNCSSVLEVYISKRRCMNGLSLMDKDMITGFINGSVALTCEQKLAADVNRSGTITSNDAYRLGAYLGGGSQSNEFAGEWRFFPASASLECDPNGSTPANPPYTILVPLSGAEVHNIDFAGIKFGDVTLDAISKTGSPAEASRVKGLSVGPNPYKDYLNLNLDLEEPSEVELQIMDLEGKILNTSIDNLPVGKHILRLDGRGWPAGVLMYNCIIGENSYSGRFVHSN